MYKAQAEADDQGAPTGEPQADTGGGDESSVEDVDFEEVK